MLWWVWWVQTTIILQAKGTLSGSYVVIHILLHILNITIVKLQVTNQASFKTERLKQHAIVVFTVWTLRTGKTSQRGSVCLCISQTPSFEEVRNKSGYKSTAKHIAKHKVKGIRCCINVDFAHGQVQTNAHDTEKVGSCSGYIFIWWLNFESQKDEHIETMNQTLLQM